MGISFGLWVKSITFIISFAVDILVMKTEVWKSVVRGSGLLFLFGGRRRWEEGQGRKCLAQCPLYRAS